MDNQLPESTRYEVKMTCEEMYLPDVRSWVQLHPEVFVEAYPPRRVNNVYLDTLDTDSLNDNLTGVGERSKLRFRWYGEAITAVQGILELKCKSNHLRWKRYRPIPAIFDLTQISWRDWIAQLRAHADDQAIVWLSLADQPSLLNRYMREYYETIDGQIRVTLDYDQRVYNQIGHLRPNLTSEMLMEQPIIIEVKSDPVFYPRVSEVLSSFPPRVERYSKYVTAMLSSSYLW